jgi:C-terminal processing protease CtpA/Prc
MIYYLQLTDRIEAISENLSEPDAEQLDLLYELMDDAREQLYDRILLYSSIYLTPTQQRRWFLYFKLGSVKLVAKEEGVSTAAVSKSLIGNSPNEKSKTRMKSPIAKLEGIIEADIKIQDILAKIRGLSNQINEIMENNI